MKYFSCAFLLITSLHLLFACHNSPHSQLETFTGTFQSVRGVMNPLSCYCGNGGYLQIETGKKVSLCLKEAVEVSCLKIKVRGNFINRAAPDEPTTPCPPESMSVFMVKELVCQ